MAALRPLSSTRRQNIVTKGASEAEALVNFKRVLSDQQVQELASDDEDWDGRSDDQRRWDD